MPEGGASASPISSRAVRAASWMAATSASESGLYLPPLMPARIGRIASDNGAARAAVRAARPPERVGRPAGAVEDVFVISRVFRWKLKRNRSLDVRGPTPCRAAATRTDCSQDQVDCNLA